MSGAARALWLALVAMFVLGTAAPAFATEIGSGATTTGVVSVSQTGSHAAIPTCIRDAGCGGGGVLTSGAGSVLVTLGAGAAVVALTMLRRRAPRIRPLFTGRLVAGRLFHPPRLSLGF